MNALILGKPISVPKMLQAAIAAGDVAAKPSPTIKAVTSAHARLQQDVFSALDDPDTVLARLGPVPAEEDALPGFTQRMHDASANVVDRVLARVIWEESDVYATYGVIKGNMPLISEYIQAAQGLAAVSNDMAELFTEYAGRKDKHSLLKFGAPVSLPAMLGAIIAFGRAIDTSKTDVAAIRNTYPALRNRVLGAVKDPDALLKRLDEFPLMSDDQVHMLAPAMLRLAQRVVDQKLFRLIWGGTKVYAHHSVNEGNAPEMIRLVRDAHALGAVSTEAARKFIDYTQRNIVDGEIDVMGNTRTLSRAGMAISVASWITLTAGSMLSPPEARNYFELFSSGGGALYLLGTLSFGWTMFASWYAERRASKVEL